MTIEQYTEYCKRNVAYVNRRMSKMAAETPRPTLRAVKTSKWSETEKRYFYGVLRGIGEYEGETLRITPADREKHEYTPDFVEEIEERYDVGGHEFAHKAKVYHEVKGNYRLGSQDAARLRWCFAAISHPADIFVWAKETKSKGLWDIEVWYDGGHTRLKQRKTKGFRFNGRGGVLWE